MFVLCTTLATPAMAQNQWAGAFAGVQIGRVETRSDATASLGGQWAVEGQALRDFVVANWSSAKTHDRYNVSVSGGFNWVAGSAVFGVEGDYSLLQGQLTETRGPVAPPGIPSLTYTFTDQLEATRLFSIRGRVGASAGQAFVYATAGWAWSSTDMGTEVLSNGGYSKAGSTTADLDGMIFGGGVEIALGANAAVRAEYLQTDQGSATFVTEYRPGSTFVTPAYTESFTQDVRFRILRFGVTFRF